MKEGRNWERGVEVALARRRLTQTIDVVLQGGIKGRYSRTRAWGGLGEVTCHIEELRDRWEGVNMLDAVAS